jgi:hypothetical protein
MNTKTTKGDTKRRSFLKFSKFAKFVRNSIVGADTIG